MRVTIPDDILDVYQTVADKQGRPIDAVVTDQLKRFSTAPPGGRFVAVSGPLLDALEARLAGGSLKGGQDLVNKVARLAGIRFHRIDLDFTPSQLAELEYRADRQGKDVVVLVREILDAITQQFFWVSGGGPAAESAKPGTPAEPTLAEKVLG